MVCGGECGDEAVDAAAEVPVGLELVGHSKRNADARADLFADTTFTLSPRRVRVQLARHAHPLDGEPGAVVLVPPPPGTTPSLILAA